MGYNSQKVNNGDRLRKFHLFKRDILNANIFARCKITSRNILNVTLQEFSRQQINTEANDAPKSTKKETCLVYMYIWKQSIRCALFLRSVPSDWTPGFLDISLSLLRPQRRSFELLNYLWSTSLHCCFQLHSYFIRRTRTTDARVRINHHHLGQGKLASSAPGLRLIRPFLPLFLRWPLSKQFIWYFVQFHP